MSREGCEVVSNCVLYLTNEDTEFSGNLTQFCHLSSTEERVHFPFIKALTHFIQVHRRWLEVPVIFTFSSSSSRHC
jgi:hypothetical protein